MKTNNTGNDCFCINYLFHTDQQVSKDLKSDWQGFQKYFTFKSVFQWAAAGLLALCLSGLWSMTSVYAAELVSINHEGDDSGYGRSDLNNIVSGISVNGRYVVFPSHASDLVENDTNQYSDIFVRDLKKGTLLWPVLTTWVTTVGTVLPCLEAMAPMVQ